MKRTVDVYLSYHHADEEIALRIHRRLRDAGIVAWFAGGDLQPGQAWEPAIQQAIADAKVVLAIYRWPRNQDLFTSRQEGEVREILERGDKRVIPVLLGHRALPPYLKHIVSVDLGKDGHDEDGWQTLLAAIRKVPKDLEQPEPPDSLVEECALGQCVLYAGAGLSAQAGFLTWAPFIENLLDWAISEQLVEFDHAESLRHALRSGAPDLAADNIVRAVEKHNRMVDLAEYLRASFVRRSGELPPPHQRLQEIRFAAALTTNFDTLLEQTFDCSPDRVLTPFDTEQLLEALGTRRFFLAKLYGTLDRPETLIVAPSQYEDRVVGNQALADFMSGLFVSRTIFFVGCSLEGIRAYLEGIRFRGSNRRHYALVGIEHDLAWRARADQLLGRYGIEVLPFTPGSDYAPFHAFLETLVQRIRSFGAGEGESLGVSTSVSGFPAKSEGSLVRSLRLEKIGPFDELELDFRSGFNVLLGDNGVGKSTILKAIAVAFCGRDAASYAERLIRFGEPEGRIVLVTDRDEYMTVLSRTSTGVEISSLPDRPLEAEGVLVVGFPPLRTVSWRSPRATPRDDGRGRPVPDDLLPLLTGDPDPRLDDLKDWVVSLDYWTRQGGSSRAMQSLVLLKELFKIFGAITGDMEIEFVRFDFELNRIIVRVNDQEVPIEAISQGMASLFGWLGVLLRRLYRLHADDPGALAKPALVLVDEIDAHMHPEWQQSLVHRLRKQFPAVQFLVTTHSPLVVAGLPVDHVFRFELDEDGEIGRVEMDREEMLGRTDQVLTGGAFGLTSTLDGFTQERIEEYDDLVAKQELTSDEQARMKELEGLIPSRIPSSGETPVERRAHDVIEWLLRERLGGEEAAPGLLERVEELIEAVGRSRRNSL